MGSIRLRYGRRCPWCGYRFILEVRSLAGRAKKSGEVVPVLLDFRGMKEVEDCPGCGRASTPWNTFSENSVDLGVSSGSVRRLAVR